MTTTTFPSSDLSHRRADMAVHAIGLILIVIGGSILIFRAMSSLEVMLVAGVVVYVLCALVSNLASSAYHFSSWHDGRVLLRRVDHAAIYLSITGTFTPLLLKAGTTWAVTILALCWVLTVVAVWNKITNATIKSRWSTASYLGLGALGLLALPDLIDVSEETVWCILAGSAAYVLGTVFYARKALPYRYSIWHAWVNIGGALMFAGIWLALF